MDCQYLGAKHQIYLANLIIVFKFSISQIRYQNCISPIYEQKRLSYQLTFCCLPEKFTTNYLILGQQHVINMQKVKIQPQQSDWQQITYARQSQQAEQEQENSYYQCGNYQHTETKKEGKDFASFNFANKKTWISFTILVIAAFTGFLIFAIQGQQPKNIGKLDENTGKQILPVLDKNIVPQQELTQQSQNNKDKHLGSFQRSLEPIIKPENFSELNLGQVKDQSKQNNVITDKKDGLNLIEIPVQKQNVTDSEVNKVHQNTTNSLYKMKAIPNKSGKTGNMSPMEKIITDNDQKEKDGNSSKNNKFPLVGIQYYAPSRLQINGIKKMNMDIDTLQIAKRYLQLGLEQPQEEVVKMEKDYYQRKYKLQSTFEGNLNRVQFRFCVVITSYNNADNQRYKLAINSALRQDYSNYHIVYINDASTDSTGSLVQKVINQRQLNSQKFKLVNSTVNRGALPSQYDAALNHCKQDQILFILDGDDGLIGTQVLKLYNHFYQTTDSWFVYGNYVYFDSQHLGASRQIPKDQLRDGGYRKSKKWITSHPKSFYNILFHKMNKSNLMDRDKQGKQTNMFRVCSDMAPTYPVIEMSGHRVKFISQMLYIYFDKTPYTNKIIRPEQQRRAADIISNMPPEKQLKCLFQEKPCLQPREYLRRRIILK